MESTGTPPTKLSKKDMHEKERAPNILILGESEDKRSEIRNILKTILAQDRYAIYDICWDQLVVGGWSQKTALLVLVGKIPDDIGISILLQFLGGGGRLLAWCCESVPFGPENASTSAQKKIIQHGQAQKVTHPLVISDSLWGAAGGQQPPPGFQRVLETSDSEGYSRPMTVSVYGRVKDTNQTCLVQLDGGALGGKAILSQVHFEKCVDENDSLALLSLILSQNLGIDCIQSKAPEYTTGYLLGDQKEIDRFLNSHSHTIRQADLTLELIPQGHQGSEPSHLILPIRVSEHPQNFSLSEYYDNLTTKTLGRLVIYTDVISSTMNVINGNFLGNNVVAIAARQTAGRGRGNNVWLSPLGCAMFSIQLSFDKDSAVGRHASLLRQIPALAVLLSVPNHKEIGMCVKWPNDIYANKSKLGGVLVESNLSGSEVIVSIGIGVNVFNSYPTVSLKSVLKESNADERSSTRIGENMSALSIEKVIARVLSELEILLEVVENDSIDKIINLYMENWIHGPVGDDSDSDNNFVRVEITGGNFVTCRIVGMDHSGFLRVRDINSGKVFSVKPDGNSFDIMNRIITIKEQN